MGDRSGPCTGESSQDCLAQAVSRMHHPCPEGPRASLVCLSTSHWSLITTVHSLQVVFGILGGLLGGFIIGCTRIFYSRLIRLVAIYGGGELKRSGQCGFSQGRLLDFIRPIPSRMSH